MTATVRFAPSPTGYLHIGNARTALFNALFAIQTGGALVLRLDDTDTARSTEAFAQTIEDDMAWLGIEVARLERQSARMARYNAVRDDLKVRGLLYACYETAEELDYKRKRQLALGKPPIYDRAGLNLTDEQCKELEAEGRTPHWRFKLEGRRVEWDDLCKGPQSIDTASQSDPVLIREDGSYLYTLPSIIDDIDFGITHVIRGEDHVSNTGTQIEIFEALGASAPRWAHHNLLVSADGAALSKREGSLSLKALREAGTQPMAVASVAALVGTANAITLEPSLQALADGFDLAKTSSGPARFEPRQIEDFSAQIVHALEPEAVDDELAALEIPAEVRAPLWLAVRANCQRPADAAAWWAMLQAPAVDGAVGDEDKAYLGAALEHLPEGALTADSWSAWTSALKGETGRKGKALFMPLRKALTGMERGPEMGPILALLGRDKAAERLAAAVR
ncbi:MAG: glutamate--tRNA ligase [Devosiaceae bacterium]|nr:glutamate--tRNA ligase [Devosiaceae bacterium MH13]